MFTIDLEKSLVDNKRKLLSKQDKFILNKMDNVKKTMSSQELEMLKDDFGMLTDNIREEQKVKDVIHKTSRYNQERVFHVNDIKKLCCKYGLRFLPSSQFNGEVDFELPKKIEEFQKEHGKIKRDNAFIAAPVESFKLQERPKDPLFFAKIDDHHYYLVHKWGNDISMLRWILNFPFSTVYTAIILNIVVYASVGMYFASLLSKLPPIGFVLGLIVTGIVVSATNVIRHKADMPFLSANGYDWNSPFKN